MMGIKRYSAGVMLALAACATTTSTPSIYYKTQAEADVALAAFDTDNPDCQLWTNWQKMCSRTGENGASDCVKDATHSAKPSDVFCLADGNGAFDSWRFLTSSNLQQSAARFCKKEVPLELSNGKIQKICTQFHKDRPFSGRDLASRRHRWCNVWSEENTGKPVCAEGSDFPELPRCKSLVSNNYNANSILYCSSVDHQYIRQCPEPRGLAGSRRQVSRPSYPIKSNEPDQEILAVADSEDYVLSIYCEK
jgi:hypothetical protein